MENKENIQDLKLEVVPGAGRQTIFLTLEIGSVKGIVNRGFGDQNIVCDTQVFVSATEFVPGPQHGGCGKFGTADIQVLNVSPFDGGFYVRLDVKSNVPIPVRIHACMRIEV
jgi:hypothetical protein